MSTGDIVTVKTRLSMLPYTELRKQAKENDIKANLKKDQLVECLARKLVGDFNPVSLKKEKRKGPRRYTVAVSSVASAESSTDGQHIDEDQSSVGKENDDGDQQEYLKAEEQMSTDKGVVVNHQAPSDAIGPLKVTDPNPSQEPPRNSRRSRRSAEMNETFDGDSDGEEKLKEAPTSSDRDSNAARRLKILAEINERAAARLAVDETNELASPINTLSAPTHQQTATGGPKKTPGDGNRFKQVHEKLFSGMESIEDHLNKKQQRHVALTNAASQHLRALATPKTKARERREAARKIPTNLIKKSPVRKQLPKKPITAPGFKFDSPRTPGKLDFNFGTATPSRIQSLQVQLHKKQVSAQKPAPEAVRKPTAVAPTSPAARVRSRQQPLRATKRLSKELPLTDKDKKPLNADRPKLAKHNKQVAEQPRTVRGGLSEPRYTPYKGRIPKFVDTSKMSDIQLNQLKRVGGLKNVRATQAPSRIATATTAAKRSVQLKQAQGRSRLVESKRQIKP